MLRLQGAKLREMAMVARCPSATGVETPSTPSPSRRRPAPSPVQRPRHPRPPPRSYAARALQPPRTRSRGEELPATSLLAPANQQADPPPSHFPPPSFCLLRHGRRPVPGGGEGKWIRQFN